MTPAEAEPAGFDFQWHFGTNRNSRERQPVAGSAVTSAAIGAKNAGLMRLTGVERQPVAGYLNPKAMGRFLG